MKPRRATDEEFVFVSRSGGPIQSERWVVQHWHRAIRATKIRPRKFYATRHTFISAALASGVNTTWLAAYCGTPADMIERHYARYLRDDTPAQLAKLTGNLARTLPKLSSDEGSGGEGDESLRSSSSTRHTTGGRRRPRTCSR